MIVVYLAYPYNDDPVGNTKNAIELARKIMLRRRDILVLTPHTCIDEVIAGTKLQKKGKMKYFLELLERCDAIVVSKCRLSEGMKKEIIHAVEMRIPIRFEEDVLDVETNSNRKS